VAAQPLARGPGWPQAPQGETAQAIGRVAIVRTARTAFPTWLPFWFPSSAWEPTVLEAPLRVVGSRPSRTCGPKQSLGPSLARRAASRIQ
jgi:hypothetical protein